MKEAGVLLPRYSSETEEMWGGCALIIAAYAAPTLLIIMSWHETKRMMSAGFLNKKRGYLSAEVIYLRLVHTLHTGTLFRFLTNTPF